MHRRSVAKHDATAFTHKHMQRACMVTLNPKRQIWACITNPKDQICPRDSFQHCTCLQQGQLFERHWTVPCCVPTKGLQHVWRTSRLHSRMQHLLDQDRYGRMILPSIQRNTQLNKSTVETRVQHRSLGGTPITMVSTQLNIKACRQLCLRPHESAAHLVKTLLCR